MPPVPAAAWGLPASGRPGLPSAVDLGDEAALSADPDGALLGLLHDARASASTPKPRVDGAVNAPEPAVVLAMRSPLPGNETGDVVQGDLFDALALSDQQLDFASEVREWYRGTGPRAERDPASDHLEGAGRPEGARRDKPARERLIPQPLVDFLRENRVWIFVACLGCALLMLAFDIMRRNARSGSQRRTTADRRLPQERRMSPASAAGAERRVASPRRSGPDRRSSPHPAPR